MKRNVLLLFFSTLLSVSALEAVLRWLEPEKHEDAVPQAHFQHHSAGLGWDGKPGSEGYYATGRCYGHVKLDEFGNRMNSVSGTFRADYETILFIGDSNTAGLEVDNDETIPALLEQELRRDGHELNVVNLGVRGYGTDQAVRKALLHAERLQPRQIVYLFTDNDFYDNNIVRLIPGNNGKGAYLRNEDGDFVSYNYPVPDYPNGFYSAVLLDPEGEPVHYSGNLSPSVDDVSPSWASQLGGELEQSFRLYEALVELKRSVFPVSLIEKKWRYWKGRQADPHAVMLDSRYDAYDVYIVLFHGLVDGGSLRISQRQYYDSQITHLLGLLSAIPSLEQLHLVEFVSEATLDLMRHDKPSANRQLFATMLEQELIDSYVNLNEVLSREGIRSHDLTCWGDDHFNVDGDRWAAEAILRGVNFDR